ncbi:MAG: ComEC/Rec2 family competence protein [Ruminococcus sp.]
MKRKMVIIGISYILGLFFASFFTNSSFVVFVILSVCAAVLIVRHKDITLKAALTAALSFAAGMLIYSAYTVNHYMPAISKAGDSSVFVGMVKSAEEYSGEFAAYILDGRFEDGTEGKVLCFTDNCGCRFGDYMRVKGTFDVPKGSYLYDSTEYYKGLSVFLEADSDCTYNVLYTEGHMAVRKVQQYREKLQRRLYTLCGQNGGSAASAMIFGNRQGLDDRIESAFYHAGLGPMLALSGFHLVLFSGICNVVGNKTRLQRIFCLVLTVFMTMLFSILSMWPVSVLRAGVMLLLARSSCLFFRKADSLSSLLISVILLTCTQPYLIYDVSFLLSVAGTFGINNLAPWITEKLPFKGMSGKCAKTFLYAAIVTLCTFPISIRFFPGISFLAPLSNVLFSPLCVIIMFCGIVIFFLGGNGFLCSLLGKAADISASLLTDGLLFMQSNATVFFPSGWDSISEAALILSVMTAAVFVITRKRRAVAFSVLTSLCIMLWGRVMLADDFEKSLRVFVLGRNNGQVVVVTYAGRTDVIDVSYDRKNPDHVRNLLYEYAIDSIDCLYLSDDINASGAAYREKLASVKAECVLTASGGQFGDALICRQSPQNADSCKISGNAYEISAENGIVTISAYGKILRITGSGNTYAAQNECDYLVTGGKNTCEIYNYDDENNCWLIYSGAGNTEIVMSDDNRLNVRGLF